MSASFFFKNINFRFVIRFVLQHDQHWSSLIWLMTIDILQKIEKIGCKPIYYYTK